MLLNSRRRRAVLAGAFLFALHCSSCRAEQHWQHRHRHRQQPVAGTERQSSTPSFSRVISVAAGLDPELAEAGRKKDKSGTGAVVVTNGDGPAASASALTSLSNSSSLSHAGWNESEIMSDQKLYHGAHVDDNVTAVTQQQQQQQQQWQIGPQRITAETMRQQWKKTFEEIKNLVIENQSSSSSYPSSEIFNRWKIFLERNDATTTTTKGDQKRRRTRFESGGIRNNSRRPATSLARRPRFDGFADWERRLQQWADDAAEYVDKGQQQLMEEWNSGGDYPFASFGKPTMLPSSTTKTTTTTTTTVEEEEELTSATLSEKLATDGQSHVNNDESDDEAEKTAAEDAPSAALTVAHDLHKDEVSITAPISPRPVKPGEPVLPHTDIGDKSKRILIVTTAALPWMTGTAVNPLLRAAYMTSGRSEAGGSVTLMLPWLERPSDQERVYGKDRVFASQEEQERYIRNWLRDTANMKDESEELGIQWYTAWQNRAENSVYSMGDITALIPSDDVDICVLEEPEHLNWYRAPGESWTTKFKHVVGIVHTNYFVYAQEQPAALIRAPAMRLLCSWMCRAHCHRLVKLSGTLDVFAAEKELVENVHGVRGTFLEAGKDLSAALRSDKGREHPVFGPEAEPKVYFIGKMLWSKGIGSLMELLKYAEESADLSVKVDMYGGGPDKDAAATRAAKLGLDMPFHGPIDHAELASTQKIFINPSTSEVLCTTVAEALAMGKFVIVPSHPSNDFFAQFPNCLTYANKEEFVGNLYYAFTHSPEPLTEKYSYALSWEAATERFVAAGSVSVAEYEEMSRVLSTPDAGVEIKLPPLIEDEERRKKLTETLLRSRERYRQFRARLSQELRQNKVLPADLQQRVVKELDKRLDLDLDEVLQSPKLRLKLSPAELDKQLLELYTSMTKGPRGDILRVIGGGNDVAMQNFYLKRQARQENGKKEGDKIEDELFSGATFALPLLFDEVTSDEEPSPTRWIKRALKRNLSQRQSDDLVPSAGGTKTRSRAGALAEAKRESTKMSLTDVRAARAAFRASASGVALLPRPQRACLSARSSRSFHGLLI